MRVKALPTIKNKEAALRLEVKKAKDKTVELEKRFNSEINSISDFAGMWNEFLPQLLTIKNVKFDTKKIAGVKTPVLQQIDFKKEEFSLFEFPSWFPDGISIIKILAEIIVEREVFNRKMVLLDLARRKTTQKVNLYEKVQIPDYQDAIIKIKRFLEDEDNLSKSAQKIVKKRLELKTGQRL